MRDDRMYIMHVCSYKHICAMVFSNDVCKLAIINSIHLSNKHEVVQCLRPKRAQHYHNCHVLVQHVGLTKPFLIMK